MLARDRHHVLKGCCIHSNCLNVLVICGVDNSAGVKDFVFGKKTSTAIFHLNQEFLTYGSLKIEKKQIGFSLADEFFDFNMILDGIPGTRQSTEKGYRGVQETISPCSFYLLIDAQV